MKRNVFVVLFCLYGTTCNCQELKGNDIYRLKATIALPIIDTIVDKIWKGFGFDTTKKHMDYNDRIRIIDLSKKFNLDVGAAWYYRRIPITFRNKIPLNFNNGEHRDVVMNEYKFENDTLSIKVFFCASQQIYGNIRPSFFGVFLFKIVGTNIRVLKSEITALDNWSGYIEGW